MSDFRDVTFGEHLFSRIDDNVYLQKLYHNILINYSRRLFHLDEMEEQPVNIGDALTFADVLSKSCGTNLSDIHKTRAQEMVALLYDMYPKDEQVKYYLGSVLASTGNFLGMNRLTPDFENASLLERVFMHFNMDYLSVPSDGGARFFPAQKEIYDSLSRPYFSYSAPTSMGKSFMMRAFIKQQIVDGAKKNFALLIPTKALINEVTSELIESLTTLLKETDYRIVTSSGSMALETKHNYIFVLTPERMLYILIDDPDLKIDYLFVDEAHKISSGDKRSAFYYKVIRWRQSRMYFCSGCQTTSSNFRRNTSVSILTNRSRTTGMNLWSMGQQTACESFCSGAVLSETQRSISEKMLIRMYEELRTIPSCLKRHYWSVQMNW